MTEVESQVGRTISLNDSRFARLFGSFLTDQGQPTDYAAANFEQAQFVSRAVRSILPRVKSNR